MTVESATWDSLRTELVGFVASRVADRSAADDIVHDVLLRALGALEGPEPPRKLRAWLYRATRNAVVDHYRARRPTEELPEDLAAPIDPEIERGLLEQIAPCLTPLVDTLSPSDRRVLEWADVEGLKQREIADREGISLSGAKSRVQRARKRLREAALACCRIELDRRGGIVHCEPRQRA